MRPSSPTPQGLRSVRHPSKVPPRIMRIRGTIQVKLSFQIDGFATESITNSRSSGLRFDGAGRHLFSEGDKNAALFFPFHFRML